MKYSIRALVLVVTVAGFLVNVSLQKAGSFWTIFVTFLIVFIVSAIIGTREFGRDVNEDPPNFS